MAEPYTTSISNSFMEKITHWLNQQRAGGRKVEPWQYEAALKAGLSTEADRASANYFRGKDLSLREQGQLSDQAYREEQLKSGEKAGLMNLAGNVGTTALMYNLLKKPAPTDGTTEPGMLSKAGDAVKSGYNKLFGPKQAPSTGASPNYAGPGVNEAPGGVDAVTSATNPWETSYDAGTGPLQTGLETTAAESGAGLTGTESAIGVAPYVDIYGAEAGGAGAGATAGSSTSMTSAGPIGAMIAAALLTKSGMKKYARGGKEEKGGLTGYLANSAQNPLAAVANPGQIFVDTGLVDEDSGPGKVLGLGGKVEREIMRPFSKCIIVTACTSPDSEDVNIAREYRDKFLAPDALRGYYIIAERAVPLIHRFTLVKWLAKKVLVDNLVKYGRHRLGKGPFPGALSIFVTTLFLDLCGAVGRRRASFVRCTGEEV